MVVQPPPNLHHVHCANSQSPHICTLAQQPSSHGWCTILCPPYIFPSIFHHFPAPRHCHTCSESGHIATFEHSCPPHHPQPGVTPLQHWPQRPSFGRLGHSLEAHHHSPATPSNVLLACTCPPPSPARSCCIWTHLSVPAIPAPGAVWPTTGPKVSEYDPAYQTMHFSEASLMHL